MSSRVLTPPPNVTVLHDMAKGHSVNRIKVARKLTHRGDMGQSRQAPCNHKVEERQFRGTCDSGEQREGGMKCPSLLLGFECRRM